MDPVQKTNIPIINPTSRSNGKPRTHNGHSLHQLAERVKTEIDFMAPLIEHVHYPVTIFGSARPKPSDPLYQQAHQLAYVLGQEGYDVISGGASGIMEAVNTGASDANAKSVGIRVKGLENLEGQHNPEDRLYTRQVECTVMDVRKMLLMSASHAFIVFPGGLGTLDEFSQVMTMMQINLTEKVPTILINDQGYWNLLIQWFDLAIARKFMDPQDLNLFQLVQTNEEVLRALRDANVPRAMGASLNGQDIQLNGSAPADGSK